MNWVKLWAIVGSMAGAVVVAKTLQIFPVKTSAELAAWVQAVGSVLAIFASAAIAIFVQRLAEASARKREQDRQAALGRAASYHLTACADALKQLADIADPLMHEINVHSLSRQKIGFDLSHYRLMLNRFPLHEVDTPDVGAAFLGMLNCLTRAEAFLTVLNSKWAKGERVRPDDGLFKIARRASEVANSFEVRLHT